MQTAKHQKLQIVNQGVNADLKTLQTGTFFVVVGLNRW